MGTVVIKVQNLYEQKTEVFVFNGEVLGIRKKALKILIPPTKNKEFQSWYNNLDCKYLTTVEIDDDEYYGTIGYSSEINTISILLKPEIKTYNFPEIEVDLRI